MKKIATAIIALGLMAAAGTARADVLGDPGFEGASSGPWLIDNWGGPWTLDFDATDLVHSGSESLRLDANGTNDPNSPPWEKAEAKQIFAIDPGSVVDGSVWVQWANLSGNTEVKLEVKWLDAALNELPGGVGIVRTVADGVNSSGWEEFSLSGAGWDELSRTAPVGASNVDFRLLMLTANDADTATGTAWFDDAFFQVPEPSSVALLAVGLLGVAGTLRFGRKSRKES